VRERELIKPRKRLSMKDLPIIVLQRFSILLLAASSIATAQETDLARLIAPPAGSAARPSKAYVQMASEGSSYVLRLDSITVQTILDTSDWPQRSRLRVLIGKVVAYDSEMSFAMPPDGPPEAAVFDIDRNGFRDILIETFPAGVTGIGANAPITMALLFHPHNKVVYQELSSFAGSYDLFFDFDGDKRYEFVCFNRVSIDTCVYYVANLFAYRHFAFVNVSISHKMFPAFFREGLKGHVKVKHPPTEVRRRCIFAKPNVWQNRLDG